MTSKKFLLLTLGFFSIAAVISDLRRILPLNLQIREGEDLQLRLTKILTETSYCYVKTPSLTSYNLKSEEPDSAGRISYWTENGECGVIVRNVNKEDAGKWRLTAKNATKTLMDTSSVEILSKVQSIENSFSIESGLGYTLTVEEQSRYCQIQQPNSNTTFLVGGKCKVDLSQPTNANAGNWSAKTGVVGQLQEVPAKVELRVFRDRLATGFIKDNDTNTIIAYCNLRFSDKEFEFCRFTKPDSTKTGFQLSEGLHSGRYGYYGTGLGNGECGIAIETPTLEDYGQWLCYVGVKDEEPFGSYIQIYNSTAYATTNRVSARALPTQSTTTSLTDKLQLKCESTAPISYCWFLSPDGEIITPKEMTVPDDAVYKYIGDGFGKGQCGIEIKTAKAQHEGQWTCHMGPEPSGFELTATITVRIAETPLAAKDRHISIATGETLTLECRTVPEKITIDYCRFLMPDGTGIHIDDKITKNNALILDNAHYWFSGISLQLGGCGLKVDQVSAKHFGNWTCAARLAHSENYDEAIDNIVVEYGEAPSSATEDTEQSTAAATTGIISGVIISIIIVVLGSAYLLKKIKAKRSQDNTSGMEIVSVATHSRRSSESTNSNGSL